MSKPDSPRARRISSAAVPILMWVLAIGVILWAQSNDLVGMGYRTAYTAGSIFVAASTTLVWFCFFTDFNRRLRLSVFWLSVAAVIVLSLTLRIDEVSGGLIPKFTFRWSPDRDAALEKIDTLASDPLGIDLAKTSDYDFPQFLGPNRDLVIADDRFNFDWNSESPRLLWKIPIGAGWSGFAAVNGYAVTMEQRGPEEITSCYEVATGQPVWASSINARHETVIGGIGPRSTPTIHEGRVYSLGATGVLRCLDGSNGEELWRHDLLQMMGVQNDTSAVAWGRAASPLVVDDLIVIPVGGPADGAKVSLIAFDLMTGEERWRGGDRQVGYASPTLATLDGKRQIINVAEASVCGHDPDTGELLWEFPWPGNSTAHANNSQAVPIDGTRVFISKGYGQGAAVFEVTEADGQWSAEEVWARRSAMKTKYSNVVLHEGFIYGLNDTILECIDAENGSNQWKSRYDYGQVLLVNDTLLVLDEEGRLFVVPANPEKHQKLAELQAVEGMTWNNLCLFDRYLLVRNGQEAACYELPLRSEP